jgi:aspartyl-tRNA(Asn)/glutamyl-tRNA(Gln) amidotransferase subunit C
MSDQISIEVFNHLVDLAAMELTPEQATYLHQQLNNQLKAIQELVSIPIDPGLEANLHGVPYEEGKSAPLREDVGKPYPDTTGILGQVPFMEDGYILVPDIPHTALK